MAKSSRTFASFEWSEPDEDVRDETGEVTTPGGSKIMEAIQAAMKQRGFHVTDVDQHDSYGWCFDTQVGDVRVWSMLQSSDTWLVICGARLGLMQKLRGRNTTEELSKVCFGLHQCLVESGKATGIQWFTREEFQRLKGQNGAPTPE